MKSKKEIANKQRKEILKKMINEISWNQIKDFIKSHHNLHNEFQQGGWRLDSRKKKHAIKIIADHGKDEDHINFFFYWYKGKKKYINLLDTYFQSEKYTKWARENKIKEGKYALPPKEFYKFFHDLSNLDALIFLLFSPIKFTPGQSNALMDIPDEKSFQNNMESPKKRTLEHINNEISDLKAKLGELRTENTKTNRKNKVLVSRLEKLKKNEKSHSEIISRLEKELSHSKSDLDVKVEWIKNEMDDKLEKCKEARDHAKSHVKHFREKLNEAENNLLHNASELEKVNKKLEEIQDSERRLFHKILEKINYQELVSQLNEPDEVDDVLSALVKAPTADSKENDINANQKLRDFWKNLLEKEKELIDKITSIQASDVVGGTYFQQWVDHKDEFDDLMYSLRARVFLLNILYRILIQQND